MLDVLLVGQQFFLEGEEEVVCLRDDFVGKIEISGVVEAAFGPELALALEELHSLLCTVHSVILLN